jgi:hypothetical protein
MEGGERQTGESQPREKKARSGRAAQTAHVRAYVEPVSGGSWNRPARTITQEFSQDFVYDAVNDYSL